jgi:hypothetical protein
MPPCVFTLHKALTSEVAAFPAAMRSFLCAKTHAVIEEKFLYYQHALSSPFETQIALAFSGRSHKLEGSCDLILSRDFLCLNFEIISFIWQSMNLQAPGRDHTCNSCVLVVLILNIVV